MSCERNRVIYLLWDFHLPDNGFVRASRDIVVSRLKIAHVRPGRRAQLSTKNPVISLKGVSFVGDISIIRGNRSIYYMYILDNQVDYILASGFLTALAHLALITCTPTAYTCQPPHHHLPTSTTSD